VLAPERILDGVLAERGDTEYSTLVTTSRRELGTKRRGKGRRVECAVECGE
jgi:hypothetical protein